MMLAQCPLPSRPAPGLHAAPERPVEPLATLPVRLPAIQALQAFATAARLGSFTRAAEQLYLTQSAVTHQIKALEGYLQVALFHRRGRGVELTEAGAALYQDISAGLQLIGRSLSSVKETAAQSAA